ncbi:MAG: hypothetical protein CL670_04610 [Balneola sp.]|jgi:uncharacterized protein (DUF433 family)|nr:hypothetical protein [Balneola sp.]MBE78412.1 hypothetical protein [Balneola sp.]|tara:strand:+ start:471 stop:1154 length:684 start_codon:yes stop_codon:yes gene_type:complete
MNEQTTVIEPQLGKGIYSVPEAAAILNMPVSKVRRWVNKYWELEFLQGADASYTWGERREKAFHFLTLIEIIAVDSFREIGVSFSKIKLAHSKLSEILETNYPFAHAELMTDGKRIFHKYLEESLLEVDEKQQFSFTQLVAPYCQKIDFQDKTQLAERFWPLGKDHEIVVDPHHSFGQPVIKGTNTTVETIYSMLNAGESPEFVASIYDLNLNAVEDVMSYMKRTAA